MNESRAKAIRQHVYGDMSHRDTTYKREKSGQIICTGFRALYKATKKKYKEMKRDGMSNMQERRVHSMEDSQSKN